MGARPDPASSSGACQLSIAFGGRGGVVAIGLDHERRRVVELDGGHAPLETLEGATLPGDRWANAASAATTIGTVTSRTATTTDGF